MASGKEIKYYFLNRVFPPVLYSFVKLHAGTIRLSVEGAEAVLERLAAGGRVVLASWHQRFYSGFYLPGSLKSPICIMISASRDGDFVANIVSRMGWVPIRGSSSRRGKEALKEMIDGIHRCRVAGHIVDGPQGPPRVVKPGLITLARQAGAAIVPTCVSYENPWVFNSWDRFMIPKPFSRVHLRYGPMISLPTGDQDPEAFEKIRLDVEATLTREYAEADSRWEK